MQDMRALEEKKRKAEAKEIEKIEKRKQLERLKEQVRSYSIKCREAMLLHCINYAPLVTKTYIPYSVAHLCSAATSH